MLNNVNSSASAVIKNLNIKKGEILNLEKGQTLWYLSNTSRNLEIVEVIIKNTVFANNYSYITVLNTKTKYDENLYLNEQYVFRTLEAAKAWAYHYKQKALINKIIQSEKTYNASKKALEELLESDEHKSYEKKS